MALHEHSFAFRLCSSVLAETHEAIHVMLGTLQPRTPASRRLLDVGCWDGESTMRYASRLGATAAGIEIFPEPAQQASDRGVDVARVDLESGAFPWENGSFDVVVANQVFEHLKNIWLPLSEAFRVLRTGGHFVISVPNLASLHNRALLALGRQPTSIRTLGPHVRGYTLRELIHLLTLGGGFEVTAVRGVGFYPLPPRLARPIARALPHASHTVIVAARKTADQPVTAWDSYRQREIASGMQTFYS